MTRKMLTATLLVAAMLLSVLSLGLVTDTADAQTFTPNRATCDYNDVLAGKNCADAIAYTGPFTNMPTAPGGPYGWGSLNPAAGAGEAAGGHAAAGGGTTGGLAHTGSESAVLGYVGAGLVAFGAVALGSRRKFF